MRFLLDCLGPRKRAGFEEGFLGMLCFNDCLWEKAVLLFTDSEYELDAIDEYVLQRGLKIWEPDFVQTSNLNKSHFGSRS